MLKPKPDPMIARDLAVWVPKKGKIERKLSWNKLDELFEEHGTKSR